MYSVESERIAMSTYGASWSIWMSVVCCAGIVLPTTARAHKPSFGDDALDHPENAYEIADPAASIVVYRSVTCEHPELWMKLDGTGQLAVGAAP
jgi:hypothetical protein